jgi:hypothetical protein
MPDRGWRPDPGVHVAVIDVQVSAADPGVGDIDLHLAGPGRGYGRVSQPDGSVACIEKLAHVSVLKQEDASSNVG